jgi:hypothetical protein
LEFRIDQRSRLETESKAPLAVGGVTPLVKENIQDPNSGKNAWCHPHPLWTYVHCCYLHLICPQKISGWWRYRKHGE